MDKNRFRWLIFAATCGTVFQTTTGCEAIGGQIASSVATTAITAILNGILLGT